MTTSTTAAGLTAGTWNIDPVHSEVGFSVRHLMVSKVRGRFSGFSGVITVADDPLSSKVRAEIDATSISTGEEARDNHLRSSDFLEVSAYPTITYESESVRQQGSDFVVEGTLTVRGVSRSVPLTLELNGVGPDPYGGTRAGFSASAEISRKDFGVDLQMPMEGGGVVVGDKISITLEIEAVLAA